MSGRVAQAWGLLPEYLAWHVLLSASALVLGLLISLPLAVAASRSARLRWPVLAFAGLIQTIPSLALLALFYPLLLALSALSQTVFGQGFSALGFLPSLLALTLYSMLPILRTGTAGILGVDPAVREAADGVGMTPRQRLFQVELPLAMPVIMAGVRTAAVWTIGAATLSTPVGQTSLGNYIFAGLQTENWVFVLFGCAASAALAMTVDQLLGLIETGAARRKRGLMIAGAALLVVGVLATLTPLAALGKPSSYVVGAKNFSEQYILAEVMAERLERSGAHVSRKEDLGSAVAYRALAAGELDVYVDYSGTLWTNVLKREDNPGRAQVLAELTTELKKRDGVVVLGSLGFENAYAFAMRADRAKALGIVSLTDLARQAPRLTLGSDLEFLSRPEWKAVDAAYDFNFKKERSFQPTFMYRALSGGEADVISAFSSDGRISADKLVVLTDPKGALPPYDAVILISPKRAGDERLLAALRPLIGSISVEAMRSANYAVDRDQGKVSPAEAARALHP
ncbi:glycine betaine ABC transporter substrate-binding protein [Phenylobacterium sp.]|uniref:glycine betaine ABC transporter substrate-binding protein n=1 Tax=Phenylobacterium sp. TaxID=1871053 RepID=UPI0027321AAD|nr:glycine betaine ABC transporter substrate-binding protein [Phenylobacterium sp.]MDP1597583.1 glycine betaine ABC transporter substrate-binding protein [Phenylobacterium sp.]MDP3592402.1 glycine betaine ABC transporter substrate-binding protein [Phenylobacterium sp.]